MLARQLSFEVSTADINPPASFVEPKRLGSGFEHVHFILTALRLNRPMLKTPVLYWAREWAKARSGQPADPYVAHYKRGLA
jgi:hypothetical protein